MFRTLQAHSLTHGGMLWFPDLTLPDPYYGLPIMCAATTMGMIKFGMNPMTGEGGGAGGMNAQQSKMMR